MPSQLNLVLLGPPGAGKGTQAARLAADLGLPLISTGDTLRASVEAKTQLGTRAKTYMDSGGLVPDDLVVALVTERLQQPDTSEGLILDGFPRTTGQANSLSLALAQQQRSLTAALLIKVPDAEIVDRIAGRRVCVEAGHSYHMTYSPPRITDVCDKDGSPLVQRGDDKPDVVRQRLDVYHEKTAPLISYYKERGLLNKIDGTQPPTKVYERVRAALGLPTAS